MPAARTAFVPGHITGFFSTHPDDDPTRAGSRGAGLTLTDGVTTTVTRASETSISLNGQPIDVEPVRTVLDALRATARVEAESDLPVGAGFGVSGALALGTALAANGAFDRRLSTNELVTIAHGAEVQAGTGLGDVVAQARGGVPIRLEPGAPPHGALDSVPQRARIEYCSFGERSTEDVLAGDTGSLDEAGRIALSRIVEEPTLGSLLYASRHFAREAGLLSEPVEEAIRAVSEADGQAAMAMLGNTVFALGSGLSDAGYDAAACTTHPAGAMLK
ncbi:pantoate kinase [Halovivax limisalsi]|uniref:pantoate kinase n=1 Tax=Halovivax limisalsi TaxID=1453760 RepID=UPI001FFD9D3D|nr:pantoate kinase [Halovivax limisalsi]